MSKRPILVTGGSGQVGTALRLATQNRFDIVAPDRATLDLTSPDSITRMVAARDDWAAVINAGAYTAVDRAESERGVAFAVNATAPGVLAEATARARVPLFHVSTDYVFNGAKPDAYVESDPVAPLGVYGASKEAGERAVRELNPRHLILRTAWVVSPWGANFIKTMLRLRAERPEVRVVNDQHGCPTSATDIADALLTLVGRAVDQPGAPMGVYHFVNAGEATWFELATAVFDRARAAGLPVPRVVPIPTSAYPTPARRPANSRLSVDRIERDHGIRPRHWRSAIDQVVTTLLDEAAKAPTTSARA